MPSKSPSQKRFMLAAANNPDFARKTGVPVSVAKEFVSADNKVARALMKKGKK